MPKKTRSTKSSAASRPKAGKIVSDKAQDSASSQLQVMPAPVTQGHVKISRQAANQRPALPNAWRLSRQSLALLWRNRGLFAGITAIYVVLNLLLVRGLASGVDMVSLKQSLGSGNGLNRIPDGLAATATVATSGSSFGDAAGAYQTILIIIVSLTVIWTLRRVLAGDTVRIRDGFYQGMYPFVPVVLIVMVIGLQLIPMLVGVSLYSLVMVNGIAVHQVEKFFWIVLLIASLAVSLYMLCSSLFALYIATLPDMTPMKALRSARELVRYRRLSVLRKLLFLPAVLLLIATLVMLPVVLWATTLAPWLFFGLSMTGLVIINTYMYTLYRELLA